MKNLRRITLFFWYLLCLYVVMAGISALGLFGIETGCISKAVPYFGLIVLVLFFVMVHLAVSKFVASLHTSPYVPSISQNKGKSFPTIETIYTGIWLLIVSALSVVALFWAISPPQFLKQLLKGLIHVSPEIREAMIMMFAAAVGSLITTILGYLDHASYRGDFETAFVPWYVARPIMGMLLGLVFYFILKGGLWTVTPPSSEPMKNLSLPGLAGIGALVGMFSRNAVEKLREFFQGIFRTEKDMANRLVESLPKELQEKVRPHWQKILDQSKKQADDTNRVPVPASSIPEPIPTPNPKSIT